MNLKKLIKEVERLEHQEKICVETTALYHAVVGKLEGIKITVAVMDKTKGIFIDSDYIPLQRDWHKLKKLLDIK